MGHKKRTQREDNTRNLDGKKLHPDFIKPSQLAKAICVDFIPGLNPRNIAPDQLYSVYTEMVILLAQKLGVHFADLVEAASHNFSFHVRNRMRRSKNEDKTLLLDCYIHYYAEGKRRVVYVPHQVYADIRYFHTLLGVEQALPLYTPGKHKSRSWAIMQDICYYLFHLDAKELRMKRIYKGRCENHIQYRDPIKAKKRAMARKKDHLKMAMQRTPEHGEVYACFVYARKLINEVGYERLQSFKQNGDLETVHRFREALLRENIHMGVRNYY